MLKISFIRQDLNFPDPRKATEDGLLAYGGDLSPSRLLLAYRSGIFPWYSKNDPILWWSPNPRLILELDNFKLRKSLKKRLKHFEIRYDTAFKQVVTACGNIPRADQNGSWIVPEMVEAYENLHALGYAHSIEAWQDDELVGGLYGVAVGKVFFGESMFAYVSDASKVAFAHLVDRLKGEGFHFIDSQIATDHLKSLGAHEVSRDTYLEMLKSDVNKEGNIGLWCQY